MQMLSTINLILNNEAIPRYQAFWNYLKYLFRKATNHFPDYIPLSNSKLYFEKYTGAAALATIFNLYDYNNMSLISCYS